MKERNVGRLLLTTVLMTCALVTAAVSKGLLSQLVLRAPPEHRSQELRFGHSICMSADGLRLGVGANGYGNQRGVFYVYEHRYGSGGSVEHWARSVLSGNDTVQAELKKPREIRLVEPGSTFGFSCSFNKDAELLAVGAPGHDMERGVVYLFAKRHTHDYEWEQMGKLQGVARRSGDNYGWAVAITDKCDIIAVSAKGRASNNGELYMYVCEEGCLNCILAETISPPVYTDTTGPHGIRVRNNFGISMALSRDGTTLAVGCPGYENEKGAVYVYSRKDGKQWSLIQRLESPNAEEYGFFGFKLDMDAAGLRIVVGADGEKKNRGSVYVYHRKSTREKFFVESHLSRSNAHKEENYGGAVSLSRDGLSLVIGVPGHGQKEKDQGAIHVYKSNRKGWKQRAYGVLSKRDSRKGTFYGWDVAVTGALTTSSYSSFVVASAPDAQEGGIVMLSKLDDRDHDQEDGREPDDDKGKCKAHEKKLFPHDALYDARKPEL